MNRRPTDLELIFTALELLLASVIYTSGYSGAAGLLAGATIGAFISRQVHGR